MPWKPPGDGELIVCETMAAITTHLRKVSVKEPVKLAGHWPRPKSLCGREVAWDTQIPVGAARCRDCVSAASGVRGS